MQAFGVGGLEWVFIIIIVVVLFFGVKKIPEIARSVGRASSEYQKAKIQAKQELNQMNVKDGVDKSTIDREKLESIADTLELILQIRMMRSSVRQSTLQSVKKGTRYSNRGLYTLSF
jgi:sec-independent protein translocase protein TatA